MSGPSIDLTGDDEDSWRSSKRVALSADAQPTGGLPATGHRPSHPYALQLNRAASGSRPAPSGGFSAYAAASTPGVFPGASNFASGSAFGTVPTGYSSQLPPSGIFPPSSFAPQALSLSQPHLSLHPSSAPLAPSKRVPSKPGPRQTSPIDVDALPSPPRRAAPLPPPPSSSSQPLLIGVLHTSALITAPSPFLDPMYSPSDKLADNAYPRGEVVLEEGKEWARVKLRHKPQDLLGSKEAINIYPWGHSSSVPPFGVVASKVSEVLGECLVKGLIRIEGWIARGSEQARICHTLHVMVLTIAPNLKWIANALANNSLFLTHPVIRWRPEWLQGAIYSNPHMDNGITDATVRKRNALLSGLSAGKSAAQVVEEQRSQIEDVFKSLKGGDDLEETLPGPSIGAHLYPHQRRALTFLRQREQEKRPPYGLAMEDYKGSSSDSLWVPSYPSASSSSSSSKKAKTPKPSSWKHSVTDEIIHSKPKECRGAILADDMGLGKSLSIVALIGSTLRSARKFELKPLETLELPSTSSRDVPSAASSFTGSVFGMPSEASAKQHRDAERKRKDDLALELYARRSRLKERSRATLIVCPLTTVSNWEDQILEHWAGPVVVFTSGSNASQKEIIKRNGRQPFKLAKQEDEDEDDSDDEDQTLRVYVYHGNQRKSDAEYIANFDVVITTFSTLATEFSKQTKTGEDAMATSTGASTPTGARSGDDLDSDGILEVDIEGNPVVGRSQAVEAEAKEVEKASKKRKRGKGSLSNLTLATMSEVTSPLQQVEWFRVVLDEAHFIKDPNTVASRAACYLEAQRRIALTGTPIQNKVDDIWALIKFIRLEPFDEKGIWSKFVTAPSKSGDSLGVRRLQIIMRHITLRRTKETKAESGEAIIDLPPRKDEIRYLEFDDKEQEIYQQHFDDSKKDFSGMLAESGTQQAKASASSNYVNILQKILRLRQICDHYLLLNDASHADDDESGEPLEYEEAVVAIGKHGMSQRRAAAVMAFFNEESMCACVECDADLSSLAAQPVKEGEPAPPPVKKTAGKGRKKGPQAVLTKCQHLYCLACFKTSVYSGWPKLTSKTIARSCARCDLDLRLETDAIEVIPPATSDAFLDSGSSSSRSKKSSSSRKPKRREEGEPLVLSTKIRHLLKDLIQFSELNPNSTNYRGAAGGQLPQTNMVEMLDAYADDDDDDQPQASGSGVKAEEGVVESMVGMEDAPAPQQQANVVDIARPEEDVKLAFGSPAPEDQPSFSLAQSSGPSFDPSTSASSLPDAFADLEEPYLSDVRSQPVKTIVFSQWTSMLDRIEDAISEAGIQYDRLDGTMKREDRTKAMERLKLDPKCEVLLVSLRAGGVGLNLTAANRVYLMDPYWNPAVENQAVDRIHRLGQKRPVICTKFIMKDSMEERMMEVQKRKSELARLSLSQTVSKSELHERRMEELKMLFS